MDTKEHESVSGAPGSRWSFRKRAWVGVGLALASLYLMLMFISPNPIEAIQVVRAVAKVKLASDAEEERQAFEFCRTKTRIWEMSLENTQDQRLDSETAMNNPSTAGRVRIGWLGLMRDLEIEHRLIAPTNLLVLTAP